MVISALIGHQMSSDGVTGEGGGAQLSLLKRIQAREIMCFHIFIEHNTNINVQGGKCT